MLFLIFVCFALSTDRRAINWKLVFFGVLAQIMFAMGVLHTTAGGQPVFWMLFGLILLFTIYRKFIKARDGVQPVTSTPPFLLLSVAWQVLFAGGVLLAADLFHQWSGLVMTVSLGGILAIALKMGDRHPELMKWNVLLSAAILTVCIYTRICPPDVFRLVLQGVSGAFVSLITIGHAGTDFLFAPLSHIKEPWGYVFAIQVLPNIIFFAAISSILYYLGVLQKIVFVFAYLLNKLKISGAESLSTAANIFLGQTEAPLMIRPYLEGMTRSEVLCIMVGGMANTAGSVLGAYVGFLGGTDVAQQHYFALHMLSQSIMSAPAAIVCAKLLFPQTNEQLISKDLAVPREKLGDNFLDALSLGTTDGLKLAVNVGAMLIVYTAVVYLLNGLMGWIGGLTHINPQIAAATGGRFQELSVQMILGYAFAPVAWLIGVHPADMVPIGQLLGEKTILNEFVAYGSLGRMKAEGAITNPKSLLIATYALCGFANFASIGIQIGGISQLAPNQRRSLTELGVRALVGGTIACLMCGCIAGALFQ
ncbi:nucleoside transporter C-terminal domain-containing protein [Paraflavisolibacter sp. H34]|uniref:nucleoside transporter C-terminal domain-containing protein n=1 Tax=Huijunlia imazamoxiresistens TaxID=3127457 RepID=UPI00301971A6